MPCEGRAQGEDHVKTEAEIRGMQLQAKGQTPRIDGCHQKLMKDRVTHALMCNVCLPHVSIYYVGSGIVSMVLVILFPASVIYLNWY